MTMFWFLIQNVFFLPAAPELVVEAGVFLIKSKLVFYAHSDTFILTRSRSEFVFLVRHFSCADSRVL